MKRLFFAVAILFATISVSAQTKVVEVNPGTFTSISVKDNFDISVKLGDIYRVTVTIIKDYADILDCKVERSELVLAVNEKLLSKEIKKQYSGKNADAAIMKAEITVPKRIVSLSLYDKAVCRELDDIFSDDQATVTLTDHAVLKGAVINASNVSISVDKKSNSMFVVNSSNLDVSLSGSSVVSLTQNCISSDIRTSGSSSLTLFGSGTNMRIQSKGSSKAILNGMSEQTEFIMAGSSNINAVNLKLDNAVVDMSGGCSLTESASKSLKILMVGGSQLVYYGEPQITIEKISRSSVNRYVE